MSSDLVITPDQWCASCGKYRATDGGERYGSLCPVCLDMTHEGREAVAARNGAHPDQVVFDEAADAASAMQFITRGQVTREHFDAQGNRVIDEMRVLDVSLVTDPLHPTWTAEQLEDDDLCESSLDRCADCEEGIAHQCGPDWVACKERCPGCQLCPLPEVDNESQPAVRDHWVYSDSESPQLCNCADPHHAHTMYRYA